MTYDDTFRRFVDVLAETLDEPASYPGRLHLSRFHVDRIVSAVAGEPPGALRRRVLLERAAHRLRSTADDVLEVALDAGYSSHEAFTRAFQRAYGCAPSIWRRTASGYELAAPNGVHFHPPGGLRLRGDRKVTTMDLVEKMVEHHVWMIGRMVENDGGDEVEELVERLVSQLEMWTAAVAGRPYAGRSGDLRSRLASAGPAFVALVRDVRDRLDETFVDAVCEPPEVFTYGGMIAHVLTFGGYRRTRALELLDSKELGYGDPMRFVAA
jgi:AraC family transcriptional regulator